MVEWEILTNPVFSLTPLCSVKKRRLSQHTVFRVASPGLRFSHILRINYLIKSSTYTPRTPGTQGRQTLDENGRCLLWSLNELCLYLCSF